MDRLTSMEVFIHVVEQGSFSAAAVRMNISAPMVAKHIAFLENRLSAKLVIKTTRRQSISAAGRDYYDHCKSVLADILAAEADIEQSISAPRGLLRINAPVSFGSLMLAPALAEFLENFPQVRVDLTLTDQIVDQVAEGFDAVIRIGELYDLSLTARPLRPYRMSICASPSYLVKMGTPQTPDDLLQHQCLNFSPWKVQKNWASVADLPNCRFRCNNGQALRMIALEGAGIILQPEILVADDLQRGRLVLLLDVYAPPPMPMHILYVGAHISPKLRALVDFIRQRFHGDGKTAT